MNGMDTQSRALLGVAALSGFIAVSAGAFGAHGAAEPQAKALLETGAHYQMVHALAAMACAILERHGLRRAVLAGWSFVAGGMLFSFSLYFIAIGQPPVIGVVTPIGGLLMLLGWASLALSAMGVVRPDKDDASAAL
jgi:uncharacterized membrane protein YgdD (TMEM256/DUF423 family)